MGESGSTRSDLFSLGIIAYQMLTGKLPYGAQVAKATTKAAQKKLKYKALPEYNREIPIWIDDALKKAVHPDPYKRYQEISEFLFDLRQPGKELLNKTRSPIMERDPVVFWKSICFILLIIIGIILSQFE